MAKINIPNISSPYASQNALNERFKMIEDVLNDKVLWRDNPIGEVNTLKNDIDLGNNDLLNVGVVSASSIMVQGRGLEEGITEAVARCLEKADEAETSANAAAANAASAEASAIRAETAAEQAELPIASPGDEGKVLTVSPSLEPEWEEVPDELPSYTALDSGKTLSVNEAGDAVEWTDPPKGSVNIAPQTIVKSQVGARPDGWTVADCDAPVMSIIADRLPIFSSNWCGGVALEASSVYSADHLPWKAFNGTSVGILDCWATSSGSFTNGIGDEWIEIDFGTVRTVASINIASRDMAAEWATSFPKDIQLIADGVVAETKTGIVAEGQGVLQNIKLTAPITCRLLRMRITAIGGSASYVTIGRFEPVFADVAQGYFGITAGLQVAYADNGRVQLSEELTSPQTVDMSAAADGTHYVYADMAEDGTFSGFGHTANKPMVGTERSGAGDLYNPVTVTHYNSSDAPIRRVYLGWVEKVADVITDVHCYSLGSSAITPIANGVDLLISTVYIENLGFLMNNGSCRPEIYAANRWFEVPEFYYQTDSHGFSGRVLTTTTWRGKTGLYLGPDPDGGSAITQAKGRLVIQRGY